MIGSLDRPYRRTIRPDGGALSETPYVWHPKFATDPINYIRASRVIGMDIQELFQFIEPDDRNLKTNSFKILGLLTRTCIEIEANLKAVLRENEFKLSERPTMAEYRKVEQSHFLSHYEILIPDWGGGPKCLAPFKSWRSNGKLGWYEDYNEVKHDRGTGFAKASFGSLVEAYAGLAVLLSAQFWRTDFSTGFGERSSRPTGFDGFESSILHGMWVRLKDPLPRKACYDFDWGFLEGAEDPFQNFRYS